MNDLKDIIIFGMLVILCTIIFMMVKTLISMMFNKKKPDHPGMDRIEYSTALLKFIREYTSQIAILDFRTYIDNHDITKLSRESVKGLIKDVANDSMSGLRLELINYDNLLFNESLLNQYIVSTSVLNIKELLNNEISATIKEE